MKNAYATSLFTATAVLSIAVPTTSTFAAEPTSDAQIITEATGGKLLDTRGSYFDTDCQQSVDYDAEVVDLNQDGQPEVFTNVHGTCLGGMAGMSMDLYIKNKSGQWVSQFGFPGVYKILETGNEGYPDIEIGGPGACFPVWRWNGAKYDIHKKCE